MRAIDGMAAETRESSSSSIAPFAKVTLLRRQVCYTSSPIMPLTLIKIVII
jgi:hypothetical protein